MPSVISFPTMSTFAIPSKCHTPSCPHAFSSAAPLPEGPNTHAVPYAPSTLLLHHSLAEVSPPLSSPSGTILPSIHQDHSPLLLCLYCENLYSLIMQQHIASH